MADPTILVVRNEVDDEYAYHCDALASYIPNALECDFPAGDRPSLESVDGVLLTGSTAGVYEVDDRPWIADQESLVRDLLEREIPTLGVCFGHQVVNSALGGTVEARDTTTQLVTADLADDPLFDGVEPVFPAVHGDIVTEPGDELELIASASYYPAFATRHREAPLWTTQFHPEFTADLRDRLEADFGWTETEHDFAELNATRVFENFRKLVEGCRSN
ncbi:type 1 glutamine amidotransferase [Natrialbaceae archaeon A-CW3]